MFLSEVKKASADWSKASAEYSKRPARPAIKAPLKRILHNPLPSRSSGRAEHDNYLMSVDSHKSYGIEAFCRRFGNRSVKTS
jgi:hypothetical protein